MGAQTVSSGFFLGVKAHAAMAGGRIDDAGHDSPLEIEALRQLEDMVRGTGVRGGGGTVVQADMDRKTPRIRAWISPSDAPSLAIVITPQRTLFALAHHASVTPPRGAWMDLAQVNGHEARGHVEAAQRIIRNVFAAHFLGNAPAQN